MSILFTYGTLKKGFKNHKLIENSKYIDTGKIVGFDLYDLGPFPGIKEGTEEVFGEIYEIDRETLKRIDRLESEGILYNRETVDVVTEDSHLTAMTYILNIDVNNTKRIHREWRSSYD